MNANEFMQLLNTLKACVEPKEWADGKSWQEVYDTCYRGDWLLWLYRRSNGYDFQKLTLTKGLCANSVRNLMKDERSIKAVDAAISFGKGTLSKDELADAAHAAHAAAYDADVAHAAAHATYAAYGAAAAHAAYGAAAAAAHATYAAYGAAAAHAAYGAAAAYAAHAAAHATYAAAYDADVAAAARKENEQKTADIVRRVLPIEIWEF